MVSVFFAISLEFSKCRILTTESFMPEPHPSTHTYNHYIAQTFAMEDSALIEAISDMTAGGLPSINVSASEGKLLHVIALAHGAKRILEIGTLGGYSGIWLARALPDSGKLISLELDAHHADVAQGNFDRAGLTDKVEIRVGPASETLDKMVANGEPLFDLVFIDADKDGYVDYLHKAYPMVRTGGIILGDNTLPDAVLDDAATSGTKRYNTAVATHPGLVTSLIPVLRSQGIDGLTISVKVA